MTKIENFLYDFYQLLIDMYLFHITQVTVEQENRLDDFLSCPVLIDKKLNMYFLLIINLILLLLKIHNLVMKEKSDLNISQICIFFI